MARPADSVVDVHFPKAGVDRTGPAWRQPARPLPGGGYARSTHLGVNVRVFEPGTGRARGGSRAGLARYVAAPVVAGWLIQDLRPLVGAGYNPPGGGVPQPSQSGRVVTLVAVSQGDVYVLNPGDTAWTAATNGTPESPPLNFVGVVFSTACNQLLWFADGTNYVYYNPALNTVLPWAATAGTLPRDSANNAPRLICTWRGRVVVSGLLLDPQNWFMSAVSDPTDFDYAPASPTPTQAVAGNNESLGLIGDVVTALIPYSDDVLIFGGDSSIYVMRGDPMAGGQIDLVTRAVGIAWGEAWCRDPAGTVYFVSNRCGIYSMVPGQQPERISQAIEPLVADLDTGSNGIRLVWDDRFQGLHVFVTPLAAPAATDHYFFEKRAGAWWVDRFADPDMDPLCCCTFDGNDPTDRVVLLGSWDGYVRTPSVTAVDDDGVPIASEVWLGPFAGPTLDEVMLKEIQPVLGANSGAVTWAVHAGATAEAALASTAAVTGTWGPGRRLTSLVRRAAHALYVRLTAVVPWQCEAVRAVIGARGKVRQRGR